MDLVQGMDEATLRAPGPDGWAIKDHLVHLAAWEHSLLALVKGTDRQAAMGVSPGAGADTDQINDAVFKAHRQESIVAVRRFSADSHASLMAALGELSDADLVRPYSFYQPGTPDEKRPVVGWVAGNTYDHYAEHLEWIKERTAPIR
jgi:hypothetical protein